MDPITLAPLAKKAAEAAVSKLVAKGLEWLQEKFKRKAFSDSAERAFTAWSEIVLLNLQALRVRDLALVYYREAAAKMLEDDQVLEELLKPLLDPADDISPDIVVLLERWNHYSIQPLPENFNWTVALKTYRDECRSEQIATPELRQRLDTQSLLDIKAALRGIVGVRPDTDLVRYARRVAEKFDPVAMEAALDPTRMREMGHRVTLAHVFIAQDVRQNPLAVELPRELLKRIADDANSDKPRRSTDEDIDEAADQDDERRLQDLRQHYMQQPRRKVLEVLCQPGQSRLVLIGDPGAGKSALTRYVLLSVLRRRGWLAEGQVPTWSEALKDHFPLLIELRDYIAQRERLGDDTSFLGYVDWLARDQGYHLTAESLDQRLKAEPSLIMFDGLDEVFDPKQREQVMEAIVGFSHRYERARVLVTSRGAGYDDRILRGAAFDHFKLEDLDEAQVSEFLTLWYRATLPSEPERQAECRERVLSAMRDFSSVRLLAGNPLLLTIMALIARSRTLPRERWQFYQLTAEVLCQHWEFDKKLSVAKPLGERLVLDDKLDLLRLIAVRMQTAKPGVAGHFIHADDLAEEIDAFFQRRFNLSPGDAAQARTGLIQQLHERNYILCLCGPQLYGFVHRSLLEYFCASEYVRRLEKTDQFSIDQLRDEVFAAHWPEDAWREILRLICSMVGVSFAADLIRYLTTDANPGWRDEFIQNGTVPRHLILAVQCLADVRDLNAPELPVVGADLLDEIDRWLSCLAEWMGSVSVFESELMPAVRELGIRWPGGSRLWRARGANLLTESVWWPASDLRGQLLAQLVADQPQQRDEFARLVVAHRDSRVRSAALSALASGWRDDATRELLGARALDDMGWEVRSAALQALASGWRDDATRDLLRARALEDQSRYVLRAALEALASGWRDDATRDLLRARALEDQNEDVRSAALQALASGWREDATRDLLRARALEDQHSSVRIATLQALASGWREDATRDLLRARALEDQNEYVRRAALQALASGWREDATRDLLHARALEDQNDDVRRAALRALASGWRDRSDLVLLSRDLDGVYPFLNWTQPLPEQHLERAAKKLQQPLNEIRQRWADLCGWLNGEPGSAPRT